MPDRDWREVERAARRVREAEQRLNEAMLAARGRGVWIKIHVTQEAELGEDDSLGPSVLVEMRAVL